MGRPVRLTDFLTDAEIARAVELYEEAPAPGNFVRAFEVEVLSPNMDRINRALGQENDSRFLAYAVDYVLSQQFRR